MSTVCTLILRALDRYHKLVIRILYPKFAGVTTYPELLPDPRHNPVDGLTFKALHH